MFTPKSSFKRRNKEEARNDSQKSHDEQQTDNFNIPYSSEESEDSEPEIAQSDSNTSNRSSLKLSEHVFGSSTVINESDLQNASYHNSHHAYGQDSIISQNYQTIKPLPESVIKGLLNEEKIISKGIDDLIKIHSQISKTGKSTKTLRNDISQYFRSLGMLYQALAELYDKETQRNSNILSTFNKWSHGKQEISNKIQEIKSEDREEGHKLSQLKKEMNSINDEISNLETRLKQMRDKRKALKSEITRSESIIQSRSSPFIEELRNIEAAEKRKIQELTDEKTIFQAYNESQNFNISTLLNKFNSLNTSQTESKIDSKKVIETVARQVESFKDRTATYRSQELLFQETSLIWENISDLLDQLECDMQSVLTSTPQNLNDSTVAKTRIINVLNQAYESLLSLKKSLNIRSNPILEQLFGTEIDTIQQSLEILNPSFRPKSTSPEAETLSSPPPTRKSSSTNTNNFSISKTAILPKSNSINIRISESVQEIQPTFVSSSGEISQSPPKIGSDVLKVSLKNKPANKKDD